MKKVVLTFDDGPWQATTPHVLEIKKSIIYRLHL